MLRKRFKHICKNTVEFLGYSEEKGLLVPWKRLFSPNLTKSAPCQCCPSGGFSDATCENCATHLSTYSFKITDNYYGGTVNLTWVAPPGWLTGSQFVTINGARNSTDCFVCDTTNSTTVQLTYYVYCTVGFVVLTVGWSGCVGTSGCADPDFTIGTYTGTGMSTLTGTKTSSNGAALPTDCSFPSPFTFNITAVTAHSGYPANTTLTFQRQ